MAATQVGVTVNPEFVQWEGEDNVLENVAGRLKAKLVATVPAVMEPSDDESGGREPPLDAGLGKDRLLDRALWGRRWLYVKSAPSFAPRRRLYRGLAFQPPEPDSLTDREGPKVASFLSALKNRGIETHVQIMAAAPPCYRVQSTGSIPDAQPLTADGRTIGNRVDANLSLAHPELRAYLAALISDLVEEYPDMDVLRFDWPEYPPYHPDSLLFDFSRHAMRLGEAHGIDVQGLRKRLVAFAPEIGAILRSDSPLPGLALDDRKGVERHLPVVAELLHYRRTLVTDYCRFLAGAVEAASKGDVKCCLQCFPPPFNALSGFSIDEIDRLVAAIGVKIYTMHWPMIERAYVERLTELIDLDPDTCLSIVGEMLGTGSGEDRTLSAVVYPRPSKAHPATDIMIESKLRQAAKLIKHANMWGITHAYGPVEDVVRRFRAVHRASAGCVHINRYGYLSDAKVAALEREIGNKEVDLVRS